MGSALRVQLVFYPDPLLKKVMPAVQDLTPELKERAQAMVPFMEREGGIGLAAPQIGWSARVLVASEDGSTAKAHVLFNPEIVKKSRETAFDEEGCLSIPGVYGEVLRHESILVRALDIDGRLIELEAEDLFARVLQHEIDHLNGILFISRLRPADKALVRGRLAELKERHPGEH